MLNNKGFLGGLLQIRKEISPKLIRENDPNEPGLVDGKFYCTNLALACGKLSSVYLAYRLDIIRPGTWSIGELKRSSKWGNEIVERWRCPSNHTSKQDHPHLTGEYKAAYLFIKKATLLPSRIVGCALVPPTLPLSP